MSGRVIQGFFIGGRMRAPTPVSRSAAIQRATSVAARPAPGAPAPPFTAQRAAVQARPAPGRPPMAHQPAQIAQRFGGGDSVEIDPAMVGLARSGGRPLPQAVLAKMEAAFGADFSAVRVHIGPQASRIGAVAFTTGNDLYFAPGQFQPESVKGQQLIGHELAHVIQQRQGRVRAPGSGVTVVQDRILEAEADRLGMRAAMHPAQPAASIQRRPASGWQSPRPAMPIQRMMAASSSRAVSSPVEEIILIAFYMSGDRNSVASALVLNANVRVCVVGTQDEKDGARTRDLLAYFRTKLEKQVYFLPTANRAVTEDVLKWVKRPDFYAAELADVKKELGIDGKANFHPPSFGTGVVAEAFKRTKRDPRGTLEKFWSIPERKEQFEKFLEYLGIDLDGRYAFLWCKKGAIVDEKSHHYTDRVTWSNLAGMIKEQSNFSPIFTGEDIGLPTPQSLTEFWLKWKTRFDEEMTREMQMAFWAFIAQRMGVNCCAIGMRSGMIEVPALLGIRTLYLEEVENEQRTRMAQWLGIVDTWYRGVMLRPNGYLQNISWIRQIEAEDERIAGTIRLVEKTAKPKLYPETRPKLLKPARAMREDLEWRTKSLIYLAFMRVLQISNAPKGVVNLVADYVGYNIELPGFAMKQAAVEGIVDWVRGATPSERKYQTLATQMINDSIPLIIEGGLVPQIAKPNGRPSEEQIERLRREKEAKKKSLTLSQ